MKSTRCAPCLHIYASGRAGLSLCGPIRDQAAAQEASARVLVSPSWPRPQPACRVQQRWPQHPCMAQAGREYDWAAQFRKLGSACSVRDSSKDLEAGQRGAGRKGHSPSGGKWGPAGVCLGTRAFQCVHKGSAAKWAHLQTKPSGMVKTSKETSKNGKRRCTSAGAK